MYKLLLAFLLYTGVVFAQSSPVVGAVGKLPPSSNSGGSAAIACVGTPGNTTGAIRQQCQTAAGALYTCNNAAGCTVAADWVGTGASGTAFTPINGMNGSTTDIHSSSFLNRFAGVALYSYPTSWKVRMRFTAGSPVIGGMKILRTLTGSTTVIDSTTVTIGSSASPTLTTPLVVDTDAISLALDNTHDYWFVIFFTSAAANNSVGYPTGANSGISPVPTGAQSLVAMANGFFNGDETGVTTIPTLSGANPPYLIVAGIIP